MGGCRVGLVRGKGKGKEEGTFSGRRRSVGLGDAEGDRHQTHAEVKIILSAHKTRRNINFAKTFVSLFFFKSVYAEKALINSEQARTEGSAKKKFRV